MVVSAASSFALLAPGPSSTAALLPLATFVFSLQPQNRHFQTQIFTSRYKKASFFFLSAPKRCRLAPKNPLDEVVLPQVGAGVAVVTEDVAGEELDAILVADAVDAQHGVPRAARHAHLNRLVSVN